MYNNIFELIIFDEPTAVLTPQEVKELFKIMNKVISNAFSNFNTTNARLGTNYCNYLLPNNFNLPIYCINFENNNNYNSKTNKNLTRKTKS